MKVEFLKPFLKDLDATGSKNTKSNLLKAIELLELADTLVEIPNIKKLKGHKSAYRVRIGDFRLGFFFEDDVILIARFVHRKDIYKVFP